MKCPKVSSSGLESSPTPEPTLPPTLHSYMLHPSLGLPSTHKPLLNGHKHCVIMDHHNQKSREKTTNSY